MTVKIDVTEPGPEIHIAVRDFGPISKGGIDLRPLTIFVGPSNTGKTWLAVLIYALHRVLSGLPGFPPVIDYLFRDLPDWLETIENVVGKLDSGSEGLRLSDLNEADHERLQSILTKPEFLGNDLKIELERCFGVNVVSELIRMPEDRNEARVSLKIGESANVPWNFHMGISGMDIHTGGRFEDFNLVRIRSALERVAGKFFSAESKPDLLSIFPNFFRDLSQELNLRGVHYLPANRSGIMHSHRVITSSLVARSTRAGLEQFPELPTLSGVTADFMQWLIHYPDPRADGDPLSRGPLDEIADALESGTLEGRIRTLRPLPDGYPEFVYRPNKAGRDIRLNQASSMVSELVPVVLLVRGTVDQGDTLIIEEPEAHLHPAAQTEMAVALARLVRAGVRVVITTHSDWLLHEIGNLMRAGALSEATGEPEPGSDGFLRSDEVGVWLFHREGDAEGSTIREIPFDPVEGVQPDDYEDVAEQLYNRSADLQNRLEEAAARGKTRT